MQRARALPTGNEKARFQTGLERTCLLTMAFSYYKKGHSIEWPYIHDGGDEGDRTPDLLTASQALSQLSYAPVQRSTIRELGPRCKDIFGKTFRRRGCRWDESAARTRGQGTRDAGSGPRGAPRASRVPPLAGFRFHPTGRHPPNDHPAVFRQEDLSKKSIGN